LSQDEYQEKRGWKKDKARKYTDEKIAERICDLKKERVKTKIFVGNSYVQMDYDKTYSDTDIPTKWFIGETIRKAELQTKKPKKKRKNSAQYLMFPTESIKRLGSMQQSADFIGKKYITGQSEPINIFSTSYYTPVKLYQIKRITAEKSTYAIQELIKLWQTYPIPNVFRIDNGLQFRGTARGKRCLGMFLKFLLNLGVIPIFGSPSKPWTNPHIEGHNRVFNEKVWNNNFFENVEQIDQECERFNQESIEYFKYQYSEFIFNGKFDYLERDQKVETEKLITVKGKKIYFARFVESFEKETKAQIVVMNDTIEIPEKYCHQFVFVEWNLETEQLLIYSECKKVITLIKKVKFTIN